MTRAPKIKLIAAATVLAIAATSGAVIYQERVHAAAQGAPTTATATTAAVTTQTTAPALALPDLSSIVAQQAAAVVNVSVEVKPGRGDDDNAARSDSDGDEDSDNPFGDLLRRFGVPFAVPPGAGNGPSMPSHGLGSGFIISSDGYILTNAHVVDHASEIRVRLSDRREFTGKIVGIDKLSDVALVKIAATGLPTVTAGDSSSLKVGQWVLAIGAPFGFDRTATQGIVSALHRNLPNDSYVPFIQTDVPINPGNSGGPLFDTAGRVIGINSQIYSRTGGFMGLSFAIPIEIAMNVADQLKTSGTVTRGWVGLALQDVSYDLARSFGLDKPRGALVASVQDGAPGGRAGLKPGDVIVGYDGHTIETSGDLPPLVANTRPGSKKSMTVVRDGKERTLDVVVEKLTDRGKTNVGSNDEGASGKRRLGAEVADLDGQTRRSTGISHGGVLVNRVGRGAAAAAGVRPGDVLLSLDGVPIEGVEQLKGLLDRLPADRPLALLVKRGDATVFLALKPHSGEVG